MIIPPTNPITVIHIGSLSIMKFAPTNPANTDARVGSNITCS
jgi:hypothetical protein